MRQYKLTAVIESEGDGYVSLCPELDIASQGDTVDEARKNLAEAVEGFLETASPEEIAGRLPAEIHVESLEVTVAEAAAHVGRDIRQILESRGFGYVRQKGSHMIMQTRSGASTITVPVPDHTEVRIGTLSSIIRQS